MVGWLVSLRQSWRGLKATPEEGDGSGFIAQSQEVGQRKEGDDEGRGSSGGTCLLMFPCQRAGP